MRDRSKDIWSDTYHQAVEDGLSEIEAEQRADLAEGRYWSALEDEADRRRKGE